MAVFPGILALESGMKTCIGWTDDMRTSGIGGRMVCEVPASCDSSYCDDDPRDCDLHHLPVLQEGRFSYRMSDHLLCDLHLPSSDPLRAGSSEQGETDGRYYSCDAWSLHDGYRYGSFSSGIKHPFIHSLTLVLSSLFRCLCQQTIPHLSVYLSIYRSSKKRNMY